MWQDPRQRADPHVGLSIGARVAVCGHQLGREGWSRGAGCFPCSAYPRREDTVIFHSGCSAVSPWLFSLQPQTTARTLLRVAPVAVVLMGRDGLGWGGTPPALLDIELVHGLRATPR